MRLSSCLHHICSCPQGKGTGIGKTEIACICGKTCKNTHSHSSIWCHRQLLHQLINYLCRSSLFCIQIEEICLPIIGAVMVDVNNRSLTFVQHLSDSILGHIQHNQIICRIAFLFRLLYSLYIWQKAKTLRNIVVYQHLHILTQTYQHLIQSQRRAKGISIRIYMGGNHQIFCLQHFGCCFL